MYKCMLAIAVLLTVANVEVAQGVDLGETQLVQVNETELGYNAFVPPGDGSPDDTWGGGTRVISEDGNKLVIVDVNNTAAFTPTMSPH